MSRDLLTILPHLVVDPLTLASAACHLRSELPSDVFSVEGCKLFVRILFHLLFVVQRHIQHPRHYVLIRHVSAPLYLDQLVVQQLDELLWTGVHHLDDVVSTNVAPVIGLHCEHVDEIPRQHIRLTQSMLRWTYAGERLFVNCFAHQSAQGHLKCS